MPEVDPERIGIIGLSYGGKWSMFASCLYDKFACAVWSDPGIVFNEKNSNVNYWEPWYLGYDPNEQRKPGVPSDDNPRTGLYKELVDAGDDLVDLHALMAPRPVLVSGGTEDPPRQLAGPQSPRRRQRPARPQEPRRPDRPQGTHPDARGAGAGAGVFGVLAEVEAIRCHQNKYSRSSSCSSWFVRIVST